MSVSDHGSGAPLADGGSGDGSRSPTAVARSAGHPNPFAPAPARPWYRRRSVVVATALVVVVGVAVVADLPEHSSPAQQVAIATSVIKAIDTDVAPCAYAVRQTFSLYGQSVGGALTASQRAQVPALMRDDQEACSFTNQSIFNLSTITVPGSTAGHDLGSVIKTVLVWSTSDALAAIDDIETLNADPSNTQARTNLAKEERLLADDRALADHEVTNVNQALGGNHVPDPALPRLPGPDSAS